MVTARAPMRSASSPAGMATAMIANPLTVKRAPVSTFERSKRSAKVGARGTIAVNCIDMARIRA